MFFLFSPPPLAETDFRSFYDGALAMRGFPIVPDWRPNLNPPTFTALFQPFTLFSMPAAFRLWTALSLLSVAASLQAIHRRFPLSLTQWLWIIGALGAVQMSEVAWWYGQVSWVLLYPITRAWLATDDRRAGVWLGLAIAVKPPVALMALALPLSTGLVAAVVSAGLTGASVAVLGVLPWARWLYLSTEVNWLPWMGNASLFGLSARLRFGRLWNVELDQLAWWVYVVIAIVAVGLTVAARRASSRNQRWAFAVLLTLLLQPLGWLYYGWWLVGPIARLRHQRWNVLALCVATIPLGFIHPDTHVSWLTAVAVGSRDLVVVALLWLAVVRNAATVIAPTTVSESPAVAT